MKLHDVLERSTRQWPRWALMVKAFKDTADTGVGDTIERLLGMGGKVFKDLLDSFEIDCGCDNRRDTFNQLYPYEQE